MANQIGIKFLPSEDQALDGKRQGSLAGVPEQAFKILSLRLPKILGARAIAPQGLLESRGSAGMPNPLSAIFESLLRVHRGGSMGGGGPMGAPMGPSPASVSSPRIIPKEPPAAFEPSQLIDHRPTMRTVDRGSSVPERRPLGGGYRTR